MKKFIVLLSTFLFLSFSMSNLTVKASPLTLNLPEGIYLIKNLSLMENTEYNIQNNSSGTVFIILIDNNQQIIESHSLPANSIKYNIGPFKYSDKLVVLGSGSITLTD